MSEAAIAAVDSMFEPAAIHPMKGDQGRNCSDQGGQSRDQMDATVVPFVRRQRRPSTTSRARL